MYQDDKVTISILMYDHLKNIERSSKDKSMYLKGYGFDGTEYYSFTDVQKELFSKLEFFEKEIDRLNKVIKQVKTPNQTFKQKLKNLFK